MIAIITDEPHAWHTRELKRAFLARGRACRTVDLRQCRIDLAQRPHGLFLPGFARGLPAAAFVRGVPGGTLEQVVLRLDILHALRELGVPVYNDARAIEKSVDKAMTSFLLHRAAVPTPLTFAAEDAACAGRFVMRELAAGRALVSKPLFGSQGKGLDRLDAVPDAPPLQAGVAYLQRWLPPRGKLFCDWRVLVAGGRALAGMRRESRHWVTNVARGGKPQPVDLADAEHADLAQMAVAAARALGMDYAGVDLMRDADGRACVIEVNGVPAWQGLQRVTELDIAGALAEDLIGRRLAASRVLSAHG
ncbi:MAG: RimK family alpha-L-glutamate ligase [Zoogloeaceae bacterium]|nr:RimK family alpha-L-glutamate ligase [Zoogloeaceae bacterium]MCK6384043.1 RimK family alpha-L-glutamate ligase [Rhodocyclaceae bacterium]